MRKLIILGLLASGACSSPTDPCDPGRSQGIGRPDFDLVAALQNHGAQVEWLGYRLDLTLFAVQTQVLRVDGVEVLEWAYCTGDQFARDLGMFGFGVYAQDPPPITLGPENHLFTFDRVMAQYDGDDGSIIDLLSDVMGAELRPD